MRKDRAMKLYIKQKVFKITDHYPVLDENQNVVYQVDQDFKIIGNRVRVSDANGRELFIVEKEILTFFPKYTVNFPDGREIHIKSRMEFFKKKIDIEQDGQELYLEGDWFDFEFTIYRNSEAIGRISREIFTWGDTYQLDVFDQRYQELVVALTIAVDCIKDTQQNN